MNICLKNNTEYLLYSERQWTTGEFAIERRVIDLNGNLQKNETIQVLSSRDECSSRIRVLISNKMKNGWEKVFSCPDFIRKYKVDFRPIALNAEVFTEAEGKKSERYVEFMNVDGIEDGFDLGMQYLAFVSPFCQDVLKVIDRNGVAKNCSTDRMLKIELTEDAQVAKKLLGE